ncbi:MAG: hypothetical protein HY808_15230 [Nitrospirae bacterium]|nr:hypothetical protein [Nitrospirota bacterium]
MARTRKRKCKHCKELFLPHPRNVQRQQYCSKPQCRKASKVDSQRRWLKKSKNKDYFHGPVHVDRVRRWREKNPGYWRKKKDPLQDRFRKNEDKNKSVNTALTPHALQDLLTRQNAVLIGLIANLTGSALQDDIGATISRMQQLGNDILNHSSKGGNYDSKETHLCSAYPKDTQTVQLGGPAPGP